jgi:hypothetical protein
MCRDEGGSNKAGLVLVVGLLLVLLVGAVELTSVPAGAGIHRDQDAVRVADHQQESFRRSYTAARGGAYQPSGPGLFGQERAQLTMDAQLNPGAGVWQVPERSTAVPPAWSGKLGGLLFESLPEVLSDLWRACRRGVRQVLG